MERLTQLEGYVEQLTEAVKKLADLSRSIGPEQLLTASDADKDVTNTRATILATVAGIKMLVGAPTDFLQNLASQVEIVASLRWLAEFQILACIPLEVSVPIKDVSDLAGVPEGHLCRVIRLMATCGFLEEPKPSLVTHTPLSAQFASDQSLVDAVIFMAESATPAALQMASATHRFGATLNPTESAYNVAMNSMQPFHVARQGRSKLGRQWSAYLCHAAGLQQEGALVDALSQLSWANLGNACIVEVGAQSTSLARRLAERFPTLRLVVQLNTTRNGTGNPDSIWQGAIMTNGRVLDTEARHGSEASSGSFLSDRITVSCRTTGMPQPITDAAVYLLHLASVRSPGGAAGAAIRAELQEHLGLLRTSGGVMLILTTRLLPEPRSLPDPDMETVARARDLTMLHLANEGEMEMTELLRILETVGDSTGKLVVSNELRSRRGHILALAVKHQAYL